MLIEKNIWNLIFNKPCLIQSLNTGWIKENKEDRIVIKIMQKIIVENVSSLITFNTIDIHDLKEM